MKHLISGIFFSLALLTATISFSNPQDTNRRNKKHRENPDNVMKQDTMTNKINNRIDPSLQKRDTLPTPPTPPVPLPDTIHNMH